MDKKKTLIIIVLAFVLLIAGAAVLYDRLGETLFIASAVLGLCNSAYAATIKSK